MDIQKDTDHIILKWYKTWWGVCLIAAAALILVCILIFGALVGYYWWQLRSGQGGNLVKFFGNKVVSSGGQSGEISKRRAELESGSDPFLGNSSAKTVIVEFIDFKCPNSRAAYPIMRQVAGKYGFLAKFIFRDLPIESTYPGSSKLAELASCAEEQGRYFEMHDLLFENQDALPGALTETDIKSLSNGAGASFAQIKECLASGRAKLGVSRDYADAVKYGARGTPTFFVNGEMVAGVIAREQWDKFFKSFEKK